MGLVSSHIIGEQFLEEDFGVVNGTSASPLELPSSALEVNVVVRVKKSGAGAPGDACNKEADPDKNQLECRLETHPCTNSKAEFEKTKKAQKCFKEVGRVASVFVMW